MSSTGITIANPLGARLISLVSLTIIWIVLHIPSVSHMEIWSQWEICQARKLLDYGFAERQGALLEPGLDSGELAFPAELNYTHHPHPMVWLYTALYAVGGGWTCVAYMLGLRLVSTLFLYAVLRKYFSAQSSWLATVLYIMCPANIVMDVETNIIAIAATYWPIAAWLAIRVRETGRGTIALGAFVFVAGQTSWLFLAILPALIWLSADPSIPVSELLKRPFALRSSRAILFGGFLTFFAFLFQLVWYTADWSEVLQYLQKQMGLAPSSFPGGISKWKMAGFVALRNAQYVGPALCLGVAAWAITRRRATNILTSVCVFFVLIFLVVEWLLLRFCLVEVSPYLYQTFPLTVLAAGAFEIAKTRSLAITLLFFSSLGYCYFTLRDSSPKRAAVVAPLAEALSESTQKNHVVLTNLIERHPPFAPWDVTSADLIRRDADRLIFYGIHDYAGIAACQQRIKNSFRNITFVISPEVSIDPSLLNWIKSQATNRTERKLEYSPESPNWLLKLRLKIWDITGRFEDRAALAPHQRQVMTLDFYEMPF